MTSFIIGGDWAGSKRKVTRQLSRNTRRRAFALLLTLSENNEANYKQTLNDLSAFLGKVEQSWRCIDYDEFDADVGLKQASGYVGLKNFGCTCYMNSLLQQLYMIPDLRAQVLNVGLGEDQSDNNLLHQLQVLFANL